MRPHLSIVFFLLPCVLALGACESKNDAATGAEKSESDIQKSLLQQVRDGTNAEQPAPKPASEDEVPAADVTSIEIILAERAAENTTVSDVLVYLVLYDKDLNMVASEGELELSYTLPDAEPESKVVKLNPARFRDQVIPDEEESTLTFLADVIHSPPAGTISIHAKFDSRLETSSTLDDEEPEGAPAGE